jgi:transposase-like protein
MVQKTEKPDVSVAEVCRRHGIATSLLFRWRSDRSKGTLATVALADGATNEVPALAALRDLVRPPNGMMAIELDDGRRVFVPAGSSPTVVLNASHSESNRDADRIGRELPGGKLLSTLSAPAILFANHAAPCRQALGGMLLHPLGELRRAHQAGLHRDAQIEGAMLETWLPSIFERPEESKTKISEQFCCNRPFAGTGWPTPSNQNSL